MEKRIYMKIKSPNKEYDEKGVRKRNKK